MAKTFEQLVPAPAGRFDGISRPYTPAEVERLRGQQTVVLPRTPDQRAELARAGGFVVPDRAIDAQSLIAHADLVISAGGTMNREAVALGVPVYTTFAGRLGAVIWHAARHSQVPVAGSEPGSI